MAKGSIYVRSDLGVEVLSQASEGAYIDPTNVLCVERGKVDQPKIDIKTTEIVCAGDGEKIKSAESVIGSKVTFSVELALPVNAKLGGVKDLFKASYCGVADDGNGNTAITPNLSSGVPCSVEFTEKRRITKVRDCKGTYTVTGKPGEIIYVKFDMSGTLEDVVELAPADADNVIPVNKLSPETDVCWGAKQCGIEVGGKTLIATEYSFSNGVSVNSESTFCGEISDAEFIEPMYDVSFRETELNEAAFSDLKNGTELAVVSPIYKKDGTDAGSFTAPKGVVESPDDRGETNGYRTAKRSLSLRSTSGNDNYTLIIK